MSNRKWRSNDPYVQMKLEIMNVSTPIRYIPHENHWTVQYSPEVEAQLAAVDQMQAAHDQFLLNMTHDQYDAWRYLCAWPEALDFLAQGTERLWLRKARNVSQMANYNARSAT